MTKVDLIAFETEVADLFNAGRIPYPVHLSDGNEDALIECFKDIRREDWCLGGWRFHTQCLLHGVPPEKLKAAIISGHSMRLTFPEHRIYCSSIVGGILPIAVGIAMGVKRRGSGERVHCWLGDMSAETGTFHEAHKYVNWQGLPLVWHIEDNGLSVLTITADAWGGRTNWEAEGVHCYRYKSKWPHAGAGKRIQF